MLTKRDWDDAMMVQSACNLQGIIGGFQRMLPRLRYSILDTEIKLYEKLVEVTDGIMAKLPDIRKEASGTDEINRHPLMQAYAVEVGILTGAIIGDTGPYITQPIPRLWCEQFLYLAGKGMGDMDTYQAAYKAVETKIEELSNVGSSNGAGAASS